MSLWTKNLVRHVHKHISITALLELAVPALHARGQRPWMVVTPGKAYSLAMCALPLLPAECSTVVGPVLMTGIPSHKPLCSVSFSGLSLSGQDMQRLSHGSSRISLQGLQPIVPPVATNMHVSCRVERCAGGAALFVLVLKLCGCGAEGGYPTTQRLT